MFQKIRIIYKVYSPFGLRILIRELLGRCLLFIKKNDAHYIFRRESLLKLLSKTFPDFIEKSKEIPLIYDEISPKIIWIFFYQGFDKAPSIVNICVNQIKKTCDGFDVRLLNKDNCHNYVCFPDYIDSKVQSGKISKTHFSDILRFMLLAEYGGFWMDATIFPSRPLDVNILQFPFYSVKIHKKDNHEISGYQWSTFFMYSKPHNSFVTSIRDFLLDYFSKYDYVIDYLMIDYVMETLRRNNIEFKKMIDNIPFSNPEIHSLTPAILNREYSEKSINTMFLGTDIFKIPLKRKYYEKTSEGILTIFGNLKNNIVRG